MPSRTDVFYNDGIYHIFDKTIDNIPIFSSDKIANEFIRTFLFYRSVKLPYRFSKFKDLDMKTKKIKWEEIMKREYFKVEILSYCLMPNHYHLLIKQVKEDGIKTFMANILNSITRYYNIFNERKGPVFLTQFKSNQIKSEEQLVYVSRYIHTNPFASSLTDIKGIFSYPFSSIDVFLEEGNNKNRIYTDSILNYFKNNRKKYANFILKNAEDQKMRHWVKYIDKFI